MKIGDVNPLVLRLQGALVGACLSALAAVLDHLLDLYWWDINMGPILQLGVVVGGLIGFLAGPGATTTTHPVPFAVWRAVQAVLVGLALLLAISSVASLGMGSPLSLDLTVLIWLPYVAVIAFILAFPVTLPLGLIAVAVMRLDRRQPGLRSFAIAGIALVTLLGTATALALPPERLPSGDSPATDAGPIHLEWTVANHTDEELVLSILVPTEDHEDGSIRGLPPCFTERGWEMVDTGWYIALERTGSYRWDDYGWDYPRPAPPLIGESDVPGQEPRVWIDVAPDGSMSATPGRPAPPEEALVVDLCLESGGATTQPR